MPFILLAFCRQTKEIFMGKQWKFTKLSNWLIISLNNQQTKWINKICLIGCYPTQLDQIPLRNESPLSRFKNLQKIPNKKCREKMVLTQRHVGSYSDLSFCRRVYNQMYNRLNENETFVFSTHDFKTSHSLPTPTPTLSENFGLFSFLVWFKWDVMERVEKGNKWMMGSRKNSCGSNYDYSFKVLLIGDSGVGKSSLLLSFISNCQQFPHDLSPTIGMLIVWVYVCVICTFYMWVGYSWFFDVWSLNFLVRKKNVQDPTFCVSVSVCSCACVLHCVCIGFIVFWLWFSLLWYLIL